MAGRSWTEILPRFEATLQQADKRPNTLKAYRQAVEGFRRWWAETEARLAKDPSRLTPVDLLAYRSYLQTVRRLEPASINRIVAGLRAFGAFLAAEGIVKEDPAKALTPLRLPERPAPDPLSHAELLRLFRAVRTDTTRGKRDWTILQLCLQAGLRLGEVADVRLEDLELSERKGVVKVRSGKGGHPREVPLNKTARAALQAYLAVRPQVSGVTHLFVSQKRRPLSPSQLYRILVGYLRQAGLDGRTPHDLREAFATILYNRHKDILLVKEALGHKRLETTLRYSKKTEAEIAQALEETELNIYRS